MIRLNSPEHVAFILIFYSFRRVKISGRREHGAIAPSKNRIPERAPAPYNAATIQEESYCFKCTHLFTETVQRTACSDVDPAVGNSGRGVGLVVQLVHCQRFRLPACLEYSDHS